MKKKLFLVIAVIAALLPSGTPAQGRYTLDCISSIGGQCKAVSYAGIGPLLTRHYYCVLGSGVSVSLIAIDTPSAPRETGRCFAGDMIQDLAVYNTGTFLNSSMHAVTAVGKAGLSVVSLNNATAPSPEGAYQDHGTFVRVAIAGLFAYCGTNDSGFQIIDISDPANPQRVAKIATPANIIDIAVSGNYAYYYASDNVLHTVNVANPASPVLGTPVSITGVAHLAVTGGFLYAGMASQIDCFSLATPAMPVYESTFNVGAGSALTAYGDSVYAASPATITVIDVTDNINWINRGSLSVTGLGTPTQMKAVGRYIYSAEWSGLRILNLDRTGNKQEGVWKSGNDALCVSIEGTRAIMGSGGLKVSDITNIISPHQTGVFAETLNVQGIQETNGYVYCACGYKGLYIFNPANGFSLVGSRAARGDMRCVAVSGTTAYCSEYEDGIEVFNVANPQAPVRLCVYDSSMSNYYHDLALSGPNAFTVGQTKMHVLNVSTPSSPAHIGSYDTLAMGMALKIAGTYAYVADNVAGFKTFDISNPVKPVRLYNLTIPGAGALFDVDVAGSIAYLVDGGRNLHLVNIATPAAPFLIKTAAMPGGQWPMRVAVSNGNIFVAAKDAGVLIYRYGPPTQARPHEAAARAMPAYVHSYAALSGRTIVCFLPKAGHLRIELFDLSGRLIARPYNGLRAQGTFTLPLGRIAAGACLLRMRIDGCTYVEKIIAGR